MTKKKRKSDDYASRQLRQIKQRGALRRSTILALMVMAALGGLASQYRHFSAWAESGKTEFIAWTTKQGFTVQQVDVKGRVRVPGQFIIEALKVERGQPVLAYDLRGAQERLMQNPWFKSVLVERRLPQTIFVRVEERIPAARWQTGGKLVLVDAEGVALTTENMDDYKHLPVIVGSEARHRITDLFALLAGQPEIANEVVAATWVGNRRWDLRLGSGTIVKLPAEDAGLALAQLAALHRDEQVLARDLTTVDLRLPDKAVLQPTTRANTRIERPDFSDFPDSGKKSI